MADLIVTASSAAHYQAFADLINEYGEWLRQRHDDVSIDRIFAHQSLADELANLATRYGPPRGKTLLVMRDGQACGAVAYRRLADDICEMKRLFVRDRFKGSGMGRNLCQALVQAARDDGYRLMRLDTGKRLTEAIALYQSMGFAVCAPYNQYPEDLMPNMVFMEMALAQAGA